MTTQYERPLTESEKLKIAIDALRMIATGRQGYSPVRKDRMPDPPTDAASLAEKTLAKINAVF